MRELLRSNDLVYLSFVMHVLNEAEIEFVQTFRNQNASELQFLIRGKPKVRVLYGRPADELEWAARFLRVALKHRPEEQEDDEEERVRDEVGTHGEEEGREEVDEGRHDDAGP